MITNIVTHLTAVLCPVDSKGINVAAGCVCNAGFSGAVEATSIAPYFKSNCLFTLCPNSSYGISVHLGCNCNAGYRGFVAATENKPFYNYTCTAVSCPMNSSGTNLPSGCLCNAGFSGQLIATESSPRFFSGSCMPVACPLNTNSIGIDLPTGCPCNIVSGYSGSIVATTSAPYYIGTCTVVTCPTNSVGANVLCGCVCNSGFRGRVVATSISPYYSTCTPMVVGDFNYTIHTFLQSSTFTTFDVMAIEYLVVAGGGGGGNAFGGGGGGGGFRTNVFGALSGGRSAAEPRYVLTKQAYTITVGLGGAGGPSGCYQKGVMGQNSILAPALTTNPNDQLLGCPIQIQPATISSTGGGAGDGYSDAAGITAGSGGSGGGSGSVASGTSNISAVLQ